MKSIYEEIYDIIRLIPKGKVSTYGAISSMVPGSTARMVGYALAGLKHGSDVPWQRVVNSKGMVSPRSDGIGDQHQRQFLENEGIHFNQSGKIDLKQFGWGVH